jgi:hypothetical protein
MRACVQISNLKKTPRRVFFSGITGKIIPAPPFALPAPAGISCVRALHHPRALSHSPLGRGDAVRAGVGCASPPSLPLQRIFSFVIPAPAGMGPMKFHKVFVGAYRVRHCARKHSHRQKFRHRVMPEEPARLIQNPVHMQNSAQGGLPKFASTRVPLVQ